MNARVPTEHEEQCTFVNWFRVKYRGVRIFAIPNGGARNVVVAAKLRNEGVSRGVPDLFIPAWNTWIEMKRRKDSRTTKEQCEWHEYLMALGHTVLVCKGAEEAKRMVLEMRERRG